ncbi:hypothetical protein Vretimale_17562, partial [Volvox reticuliferus]
PPPPPPPPPPSPSPPPPPPLPPPPSPSPPPPPPLSVDDFILPASLHPESAYFDAAVNLLYLGSERTWKDVFMADRPDNVLQFTGACGVMYSSSGQAALPTSITFDGNTCFASMKKNLPNWDVSATSRFTAVWIGRFRGPASEPQMLLTLSRTPDDFNQEMTWSNQAAALFSSSTGYGFLNSFPTMTTAPGQWAMRVLSRSLDASGTGVTMSYYWYDGSGMLNVQRYA